MRKFKRGDFYEDCFYHPCIVVTASVKHDDLSGISLIDGSSPRGCSLEHCNPPKLSMNKAILIKEPLMNSIIIRKRLLKSIS